MKKVLGLGLLAIAFASCSDDDGPSVDVSQLTKKWYPQSYVIAGQTFPFEQDEGACGDDYLEFKTDNTTTYYDVYDCDGTTPEVWVDNGTYSLDGHTLTLDMYGDGDIQTATIDELTSGKLKITTEYDFDDDGTPESYSEVYTSTP